MEGIRNTFLNGKPDHIISDIYQIYSEKCQGIVRPDIVFFGEALPDALWKNMKTDFSACDLLIVLGTSLTVQPFANLVGEVGRNVPRLFINRTKPGKASLLGKHKSLFDYK